MPTLSRFSISMENALVKEFDTYITKHAYTNRSEAVRDLVRDRLVQEKWQDKNSETVGTITLIYDHHHGDLTEKLTEHQHDEHDVVISTMHVHLDHHNCLEVLAVKGKAGQIRKISDKLISTRGVKHGKLVMTVSGGNL